MAEQNRLSRISGKVRTISYTGDDCKVTDPYIIGHLNIEKLQDDYLLKLYAEWQRTAEFEEIAQECVEESTNFFSSEQFEGFLAWLEDKHGYFQFVVSDAMLAFPVIEVTEENSDDDENAYIDRNYGNERLGGDFY